MIRRIVWLIALCAALAAAADKKKKEPEMAPLERYIQDAQVAIAPASTASTGSLWNDAAPLARLAMDHRARSVYDTLTIVVAERASAVARGTVQTQRQSSAKAGITAAGGKINPLTALGSLADLSSNQSLDGQGATTRETVLTTTLSGIVRAVLPNGNLIVEGTKEVQLNSERQLVTVRGIARPADIAPDNTISSDRLAQMEVRINGKGVVGDAIRRPNFLYRLLLSLLPF
jgi:flagellar L-ring protein precursor FlgH